MKITSNINATKWLASLEELKKATRQNMQTLMKQQAKSFITGVLGITPPFSRDWRENNTPAWEKAKLRAENAQQADLHNAFIVLTGKTASKESKGVTFESYLALRNKKRRVKSQDPKRGITQAKFSQFAKLLWAHAGWTLSGWKDAAAKVNLKLPKWVQNRSAPGTADLKSTPDIFRLIIQNSSGHTDEKSIQSKMDIALKRLTSINISRVKQMAERKAKQLKVSK